MNMSLPISNILSLVLFAITIFFFHCSCESVNTTEEFISGLTLVEFLSCGTSSEVLRTASASPWPSNSLIRLLRLSADVDLRNLGILIFAY